jgi:hypothetical protein
LPAAGGTSTGDAFLDDFEGPALDTGVWIPHYLPHWSSRAESAATYAVLDSALRLTIPPEQGLWCPGDHDPLRVSGIQSGVFSGDVGSTIGQQPFRDGLTMREAQPVQWGWTPEYGLLEVRARMDLSPRSMASVCSTSRTGLGRPSCAATCRSWPLTTSAARRCRDSDPALSCVSQAAR